MAVDTAQKRSSMINFGEIDQMLFQVDSAVDLDDRQHLLGCYSGITFGSITLSPTICEPLTIAFINNGRTTMALTIRAGALVLFLSKRKFNPILSKISIVMLR